MAATKTINLLPEIFQTETNKKFLNATLDQLVSEPNFKKINGYIGRKFAPTFKTSDSYVSEIDAERSNYQLEPSTVVIDPETNTVNFYSSYIDLINKIKHYGGNVTNHSRLFSNEYYSYNGRFDFDKFVNFSQYYWIANGPDAVTVSANGVPLDYTWDVTLDPLTGQYLFGTAGETNPNITLAHGGSYTFNVSTDAFWLQTVPSITGFDPSHPNINVRSVFGVTNNGASSGSVKFIVPQPEGQRRFTEMPLVQSVNYATNIAYKDLQGNTSANIKTQFGGIDGVRANINGAFIIFVDAGVDDSLWTVDSVVVPAADRTKTWLVQVDTSDIVTLVPYSTVNPNEQVYVRSGNLNASKSFYVTYNNVFKEVPLITAPLTSLYYQNGSNNNSGTITLVDPAAATIDPLTDIVGKTSYTSPNGIKFTNGLKVTFDSTAGPQFGGNEYYVEGVGTGIHLVAVADLLAAELGNSDTPDYMTINRSSIDLNAWTRSNRWFHQDVLKAAATYLNADLVLDQTTRATRPIIEFDANLKLFNYGQIAQAPIDLLDLVITDAYQQVETVAATTPTTLVITINGISTTLTDGDRVVFSADSNPTIRTKIYIFKIVDISENPATTQYIGTITETGETINEGNNLLVKTTGNEYWFNGTAWILAQQKTSVNQPPMFDMFDEDNISFGDANTYVNSSFKGTKIFSYKVGTGINDTVLGFPLSYRTFNNVGDIQFDNNIEIDSFTYLVSPTTKTVDVNTGYLHYVTGLNQFTSANTWTKVTADSKQYQIINYVADGTNNQFEIDITPVKDDGRPYTKVLINSKVIDTAYYSLTYSGVRQVVEISSSLLNAGDSVNILIYSNQVSKLGYYQVPDNIDNNALNQLFDTLTLGQLRNHLIALGQNNQLVTGVIPGSSNIRDISIKQQGGNILKHSSPAIYSSLFLIDPAMNFVDSITHAQKEYSKFKNKLLELSTRVEITIDDIAGSLDTLISSINGVKNKNFAWYNSDMIPWGDKSKTVLPSYTVLDPRIRRYELTKIFDDTTLSNQAVLVYLTRTVNNTVTKTLLVKGRDYTFNPTNPGFTIGDSFNLNYDDILTVVEYSDTDGNYVPETPTKLGLYPKFVPEMYVDDTYSTPISVIRGHDGSITPAFNDYRDDLLLEFERRIYNNIKQSFAHADMYKHLPGKFRNTDYSLEEFNQILSTSFLTWVGNNRLDFTTNSYFQSNNPFTWNYKNFHDTIDGGALPGSWKAIFQWLFDTDRPHTHPWEMLGFQTMPAYWTDRYGPAPYTGGNLLLWTDLSLGYIHAGDRAGIDPVFARPGLTNIIPVDDAGTLLSPEKFVVVDFDSAKANVSYSIGDQGPAETAWRRSSDFAYAMQIAMALTKPAHYFSELINVDRISTDPVVGQFLVRATNQHITPAAIEVNGATNSTGVTQRTAGYINWICDHLKNLGIADPQTKIKSTLSNLNVQLSYKVGGFTDKNYVKVLAEQGSPSSTNDSIVVPDDNYRIELRKSVPVSKIAYSAVIVEKSQNGYTVSGYNLSTPYFTIVPSLANNNAYTVSAAKATGVIYKDYQKIRVRVPYGTEFTSAQEVVDFLVSYQRQLQSQGFIFTDYDSDLGEKKDWILSAKEFLTWTQQGWLPGNVIILSPVNDALSVETTNSVVDEITNLPNGSKLFDPNFAIIKSNAFTVLREDNSFKVTSLRGQSIAFAELNLVQFEHVLVFDNKTVFNDIIYAPETGNRQYRLKFIGSKTANWTGAMNPPGFIYSSTSVDNWQPGKDYKRGDLVSYKTNYYVALTKVIANDVFDIVSWKQVDRSSIKTGLLSNFAASAGQFENYYDLDNQPVNETQNFYSNGIVGFRERQYLTDLAIDVETQAKFYHGYIKQKGTKNAILALAQAQLSNISNEINVFEEWALRVGEYGAIDSNKFVELELRDSVINSNPVAVKLINSTEMAEAGVVNYRPVDVYNSSLDYAPNIFDIYNESADRIGLPTAGYVNVDHVDATIFDLADYTSLGNLMPNIGTGYTIWAAKGFSGAWDVYRTNETNCSIESLSYNIDNIATVTTNVAHNLSTGDIVVIKNFDDRFNGFYQIYAVTGVKTFSIGLRQNYALLSTLQTISGRGLLFKLGSIKINTPSDIDTIMPAYGWEENNKVWVNNLDGNGNWGVYNKTMPWASESKILLNTSEYQGNDNFGQSIVLSKDATTMYVGAPLGGTGRAAVFLKTSTGSWIENSNFTNYSTGTTKFGQVVDASDTTFIAASPESQNKTGYVFVYTVDIAEGISINQVITAASGTTNDLFGASVSVSQDGLWLYVGAPGANTVYVYGRKSVTTDSDALIATGSNRVFTLSNSVADSSDILVTGSQPYIPNIDYTVSGTTLTFATNPAAGSILVTYRSYYKLVTTLTGSGNFGISVKTNATGDQLVVGANTANVAGVVESGAAYVYDRMIEGFIADDRTNTFIPNRNLSSIYRVTLDGNLLAETVDYNVINNNIQFVVTPAAGKKVGIEINSFTLVQTITSDTPAARQRMATSLDIGNDTVYLGAPLYNLPYYQSGAVYRFTNQGNKYGTITGAAPNPTVNAGDSIRINQVELVFQGTSLDYVVAAINNSRIAGISATNSSGYLKITSTRTDSTKLSILPGVGTALTDLGITLYAQSQLLTHPARGEQEFFGSVVKTNSTGTTLAVSSVGAKTISTTTFDTTGTKFDSLSTDFKDPIANSGAVYVYDLMDNPFETVTNSAKLAYVQQLASASLGPNFNFGAAIDIKNKFIAVGATLDNDVTNNGGSVFGFSNPTSNQGWDLISYNQPRVEPESIDKIYIYSKKSKTILARLDYFDPIKGKLLGAAQQDIDFIEEADPAIYNDSTGIDGTVTTKYDATFHWTNQQTGRTWLDTSTMRYIDYEQGDTLYRSKHWGELFPGSVVKVYEWAESKWLPSQYVENGGNGTPKYPNDSAYVTYTFVDASTGLFSTLYYYWVSDKTTVDTAQTNRTNSIYAIQQMISAPRDQGISYAAALTTNSLNLYNINNYLSDSDVVLHIDYSPATTTNIIHSEYELVQEGSASSTVPTRIINKLKDSLAGIDMAGLVVPDPSLSAANKTGIGIRPRQTMFDNRLTALENFVKYVNSVIKLYPIVKRCNLSNLKSGELAPASGTGAWDEVVDTRSNLDYLLTTSLSNGYKVLVTNDTDNDGLWSIHTWSTETSSWTLTRIQSYSTSLYWKKIDWYASNFDYTVKTTYTIDRYYQVDSLTLTAGNTIKLKDDGTGNFVYYRVASDLSLEQVGIQNGTIELSSSMYNLADGNMAFDNDNFDTVRFDKNPDNETRSIFAAVYEDIFVKDLEVEFNNLFFSLVNYIFSEQKSTDWIFKTSFISVLHRIRELVQYPSYVKDNQTFYEDYIKEVKPYRSQIREYVPAYSGIDYLHTGSTDFDLPSYYDSTSGTFRSPDGTYVSDSALLANNANYVDWNSNHKYSVVEIAIANGGSGFTLTPNVVITGGDGSGVVAHATINSTYGNISSITIINPGSGFTVPPTISVNGNGTGAILVPKLKTVYYKPDPLSSYNTARSFDTTIKFDRTSYTSDVVEWEPNTSYSATISTSNNTMWLSAGSLISYNGVIYKPVTANVTSEVTFDADLYEVVSPANVLISTNERIIGYYQPLVGMPAKDLAALVNNIDYPGVQVTGLTFNEFTSNINVGTGIEFISANSSIVSTNATIDFVALGYKLNQQITIIGSTSNDKSFGIVNITPSSMIVDTAPVTDEAAGANVTIRYIDSNDIKLLDSTIQSSYLDTALGTRPEDINIEGGAYIDTFSSHAPEELLPGRMYDALDMKVFTKILGNTSILGYRVFYNMNEEVEYTRIADANTTTLSADLLLTDSNVQVTDSSVLPAPNPELAIPGVVFINGEKITYYTKDDTTNTLGQIRRGVDGTGAASVHAADSLVVDSSLQQKINTNGTTSWLNMTANVTDGTGFEGSTSSEVTFMKASPSYTP